MSTSDMLADKEVLMGDDRPPVTKESGLVTKLRVFAIVLAVAGVATYLTTQQRSQVARQASASMALTSLWRPVPPAEHVQCKIQVFAKAGFQHLVQELETGFDAYEDMRSNGILRDYDHIASLRVDGECTAVLLDRHHPTSWPCFFPPAGYKDEDVLRRRCPNLAASRALGLQRGALTDRDISTILWKSNPLNDTDVCNAPVANDAGSASTAQAVANAWFYENVRVYVVKMDRNVDRWDNINSELQSQNISNYDRVTPPDVGNQDVINNAKNSGEIRNRNFVPDRPDDLYVAWGHFMAWDMAIRDLKSYAIVIAEDVSLAPDFMRKVWELVSHRAPADWDLIALHNRNPLGTCVASGVLRPPKMSGCLYPAAGTEGFIFRPRQLPELKDLMAARFFEADHVTCSFDTFLYGSADKFTVYSVDSDHALLYKAMPSPSEQVLEGTGF